MKPMPKYTIYRYTVYLNRLNTNIMYIVTYTIDITYYDGYPVQTKILQNFNKNKLDVIFFYRRASHFYHNWITKIQLFITII